MGLFDSLSGLVDNVGGIVQKVGGVAKDVNALAHLGKGTPVVYTTMPVAVAPGVKNSLATSPGDGSWLSSNVLLVIVGLGVIVWLVKRN